MRILVVEDDAMLREAVVTLLREEAFLVDEAANGDDGFFMAGQDIYDLLVLDLMLPGMSGIDVVKGIRGRKIGVPILILTARDSIEDRVVGLNTGADDYLGKPFALPELLARVKALLRRGGSGKETSLSCCGITVNPRMKEGFVESQALHLTVKEFELLEFLLINQGQIVTREQLQDRIWGFSSETAISNVDLYVHYLRKKLAPFGKDSLLRTIRGAGFIFTQSV